MNGEFFEALHLLCKEKDIPMDYMVDRIAAAIKNALKRDYNVEDNAIVEIDPQTQKFRVAIRKQIVEEVEEAVEGAVEEVEEAVEDATDAE